MSITPNEPRWSNVGEKADCHGSPRICRHPIPRCSTSSDEAQHLSPHFDFIVVDESHRSIYNTFGEVLDYFKVITSARRPPTDIIDRNTLQLSIAKTYPRLPTHL